MCYRIYDIDIFLVQNVCYQSWIDTYIFIDCIAIREQEVQIPWPSASRQR